VEQRQDINWGWMGVFIIILVVVSPLFFVYNIIITWNDAITYSLFDLYPKIYIVTVIDVFLRSLLIVFSIYTGVSLFLLRYNAIQTAKKFLIIGLIYGLISPFLIYFVDFPEESMYLIGSEIGSGIFRAFIFFGVWYWFVTSSRTVQRIYFTNEEPARICPSCNEEIPINAEICPYCGMIFDFNKVRTTDVGNN
jgi:hypothetical protein